MVIPGAVFIFAGLLIGSQATHSTGAPNHLNESKVDSQKIAGTLEQLSSTPPIVPFLGDLGVGLLSPVHSLRFFRNNKSLLFIGLAPQCIGLAAFVWVSTTHLVPYVNNFITSELPASWQTGALLNLVSLLVFMLLLLAYGLICVPVVGALSSPIYDHIAAKTYEITTGQKLPKQGLGEMLSSIATEIVKLSVYFGLLGLSFIIPALAPFFFFFSIWYLGWDHLDRTLLLMNKTLGQRVAFGFKHVLACLSLGAWSFIPLLGGLFAFTFASAGALAVGRLTARKRGQV